MVITSFTAKLSDWSDLGPTQKGAIAFTLSDSKNGLFCKIKIGDIEEFQSVHILDGIK